MRRIKLQVIIFLSLFAIQSIDCQEVIKGMVTDAAYNDAIIGANVVIEGSTEGTITEWDGSFEISTTQSFPFTLRISYIGYADQLVEVTENVRINIVLQEDAAILEEVVVKGSRISDKQKESPLTIEALDIIAIKETPAANFYDGLGALKGVDLTAASLGFKVINTRGFNSTSPVRSLQIIDGVDNQAPGLNFSLGNFLGSSELDVNKVEIIVGASSAFYGPNAFNGVISMETKDPFFHDGLSAMVKFGERNLMNAAVRWAQKIQNKDGKDVFAYKLNFEALRADDWVADNYDPIDGSQVDADNPGRYDAVNVYGDEYQSGNDFSSFPISQSQQGIYYRTGYREIDLVDYDTRNYKASAALHYRLKPEQDALSPEIILSTSYGSGTTVYQGDNRFSLKGISFLQNRLELRKKNKYFLRAYTTRTGAGDSYDPYFTALELQEAAKGDREWSIDYNDYWLNTIQPRIGESGFPQLMIEIDPDTGLPIVNFDADAARQWIVDNNDLLTMWHTEAEGFANGPGQSGSSAVAFFEPGTERFQQEFDRITGSLRSEGGTQFFDNSALYHVHGEYRFTPTWVDYITVGSNFRLYTPESRGTVFSDTADVSITNSEFGFYTGAQKKLGEENKWRLQVAMRVDKNQNFDDWLFSPAGSVIFTPSENNFFRVSFSSAIRNPTLSDQYLFLDVGRATLAGNLDGVQGLATIESLFDYFDNPGPDVIEYFDIDPIRPEEVKTFEAGYRTTLFGQVFVDASYYRSWYDNFLGFNIGADVDLDPASGFVRNLDIFRFAANSNNQVVTQGASIGLNYYLNDKFTLNTNYSWNKLVKSDEDDPIIPAFNTPEHKYNIGFSGRNLEIAGVRNFSFNVNYKWIEGFLFEGSPQFTGFIPTYDMLDAQISFGFPKIKSSVKIGASNVLDNRNFQTYGGPRIGRLAYITFNYGI